MAPVRSGSTEPNPPPALALAVERICFLEWRLEQEAATLATERAQSRLLRQNLAEAAQEKASLAQRVATLEARIADAHTDQQNLTDRLSAVGPVVQEDGRTARELAELCRQLLWERQRAEVKSQALHHARERVELLERAQTRFFDKLVEWQRLGADQVDLAEFIAELRAEIVTLAEENRAYADREENLKLSLLEAQAQNRPESWPTALPEALEPAWNLNTSAQDALEILPEPSRTRALEKFAELTHPAASVRKNAARTLVRLAGPNAAFALSSVIINASTDDKVEFLSALAETRSPPAKATVERLLHDPDWRVRSAAVSAAGRLWASLKENPEHLFAMALADDDPKVRRRAVLEVAGQPGIDNLALLRPLQKDPDPATRRAVMVALAGAHDHRGLRRGLMDSEPKIRETAARALGAESLLALSYGARRQALAQHRGQSWKK